MQQWKEHPNALLHVENYSPDLDLASRDAFLWAQETTREKERVNSRSRFFLELDILQAWWKDVKWPKRRNWQRKEQPQTGCNWVSFFLQDAICWMPSVADWNIYIDCTLIGFDKVTSGKNSAWYLVLKFW